MGYLKQHTFRQWLAWRLVRIAHRLYDPEWYQCINITTATGRELRINIIGDDYGCGISSTSEIHWRPEAGGACFAEEDGWRFTWPEEVRWDEYDRQLDAAVGSVNGDQQ